MTKTKDKFVILGSLQDCMDFLSEKGGETQQYTLTRILIENDEGEQMNMYGLSKNDSPKIIRSEIRLKELDDYDG